MDLKNWTILLLSISVFIFGCQPEELLIEIESIEEPELSEGSGFLEVGTLPADANIYLDNIYSGKSPNTLYNIKAGFHVVLVKKKGYEDSISDVEIEPGRKSYLDINLIKIPEVEEEIEETEETVPEAEEEVVVIGTFGSNGVLNIGKGILLYYDFSEAQFTDNKLTESDLFSKRFNDHILFTRYNPINIKVIEKSIENVEKGDCAGITGQLGFLYSGQSLCVITREKTIAVLGGNWDDTENTKLTWKLFS